MKLWLWFVLGMSVLGISFWLIVITHANPVPVTVFVVTTAVASIGQFWMMYVALRCEKKPWPMFWLAFVPFASLWYYFGRVRHDKRLMRWRGFGWPDQ
jgi:hypothetical protein